MVHTDGYWFLQVLDISTTAGLCKNCLPFLNSLQFPLHKLIVSAENTETAVQLPAGEMQLLAL
jgi:hypothetical protein